MLYIKIELKIFKITLLNLIIFIKLDIKVLHYANIISLF